jgi:diacylglycerol O-acyltransferase / wax synthase
MTGEQIERLSGDDLMQLASDVGPVPWQVGVILQIDTGPGFDLSKALAAIAQRITAVPRLRQVLVRPPLGCGRPIWVDDPRFDVRHHVRCVPCRPPGDERALLDAAVAVVTERLPWERPLWRATFVTGLPGSGVALVVVFHHVLADGVGGLAVLANLVDGASGADDRPFPRTAPSRRDLAVDALRARVAVLMRLPGLFPLLRGAIAELSPGGLTHAPATSLNAPTGAKRRLAVARADLDRLHDVAREHDATVNDVVLTAMTGALAALLARRGEPAESLVVSVPVSGRTSSKTAELGNQLGVMAVNLPLCPDRMDRLERIASITRAQKTAARGASGALLGPAFRILARVGAFRRFTNRQHMVNVFETNLRGPEQELSFGGNRIIDVLPVTAITGNVAMSFAVMSYVKKITVVIVADPESQPDVDLLATLLQQELDALANELTADRPASRRR